MKIPYSLFCSVILLFLPAWTSAEVLPVRAVDSAILSLVKDLPPNTGAYLPAFTCIDRYGGAGLSAYTSFRTNGPGTRDYCMKWVYAPTRKRALYCGANHGSPHKFNDVWEYDLPSNTWIMLHKPDPGVVPCHTWWGLAYDRKREQLLWASGGGCGSWINWHVYKPYEPEKGWDTLAFSNAPPATIGLGAAFEYLEDSDKLLWYHNGWQSPGMRQLDPATLAWTTLIPGSTVYNACPTCPKTEQVMVYDSATRTLIAGRGPSIHECALSDNLWRITATDSSVSLLDFKGSLVWDGDRRLALWYGDGGKLYAYDPRTDNLVRLRPAGDTCAGLGMAYYDETHKVMVVYVNRGVPTRIWVYRPPERLDLASENTGTGALSAPLKVSVLHGPGSITLFLEDDRTSVNDAALYSTAGRKIAGLRFFRQSPAQWTASLDTEHVSSGVYLVRIAASSGNYARLITLIR